MNIKLPLTAEDIDRLEENAPFECQDFRDLFDQARRAIELDKLRDSWADIACMETQRRRDKDALLREMTSCKSIEGKRAESWRNEARKSQASNREAREVILGLLEYEEVYDISCICREFGDNICSIHQATAWLDDYKENNNE